LLTEKNQVTGLVALDKETRTSYEYQAKVVVNASGPWSAAVADNLDGRRSSLYKNCLAWNVLFNREAISDFAVAIAPNRPKAKTYFAHNWKGRLLIGTGNAPCSEKVTEPTPSGSQLKDFIADLNEAVPQLQLNLTDIAQVLAGFRPVKTPETIRVADRELIIDHEQYGGAVGFYSVAGVKFTTARLVAEKTIKKIFPDLAITPPPVTVREVTEESLQSAAFFAYDWYPAPNDFNWQKQLLSLVAEEAVQHLDDLIFRRTSLGDNIHRVSAIAPQMCEFLGWNSERSQQELLRVENYVASREAKLNNFTDLGI
jgi:glycerol-3-phosphate dehydrogenase